MVKTNTSLFLLFLFLLFSFFSISYASSTCPNAPHGAIYCQAILIQNMANSTVAQGTQIPITYNALAYSSYLASNLQNIVFYNSANGSIITSWLEGNLSNELQNSNLWLSSNILIWIKIPTSIPADYNYSNISIAYFPKNVSELNNITTGEAPQLSSLYAQYDNGALLFNSYQNFAGTSTPSGWHIFKTGTSYIKQDNGLSTNGSYSYGVYAVITNSTNYGLNSSRVLDALESIENSNSLYNYYLGVGYSNGYGTAYGYSNSTFVGWSNEYGRSPISPFSALSSEGGVTLGNFTPGYLTGVFSTYWPLISKAQFYLNYNYSETINTTIPKNTLSIGIAGRSSGNLIKLYWIRERNYLANKSIPNIYFNKITSINNTTPPPSNNSSNSSVSYDQIVSFDPSLYSNYESYNLGNIRFYNKNSELYSWCESGCNSSSTNATFWVKILNETNTLNKNITVKFLQNVSQYDGIYAGEAPELSSIYGKYDNGAKVFPLYDNFIGNTLNTSKWYFSECPSSYKVNNGLEVNTTHCGYYDPVPGTTSSDPSNGIMGAYITNASIRGAGFVFCWLHTGGYCSPAAGVRNGTTLLYSDKPGQDNTGYFIDSVTNNNSTFKIDWAFIATYPPNGVMPNTTLRFIYPSVNFTMSSYEQQINFNPSLYFNYESYNLGNIRFYNKNSELYSWCESGCNSSSTNATFWVKTLNGTTSISIIFLNTTTQYDGIYAGEAPELSSIYGKYDNGAKVFPLYDNFIGNTLNTSKWYFSECPSSYKVNNGLEVNTTHCGYYDPVPGTTSSDPSNGIMGAYITNASIRGAGFVFCWLHTGGYCSPAAGVRNGTTLLYSDKPGQDNTGYFIDSVTNNNSTFKIDWAFIATYPPNGVMPNITIVPSLSPEISYTLAENASVSIFSTSTSKTIKKAQTYEMFSSVSGIIAPAISYQWFEKTPMASFYFPIPGGFYSYHNFTTNTSTVQGNYSFKLRIVANQLILFSAPFSISVSNSTYIPNVVKGLNNPSGVSVSSNGAYVYVENYGNNTISIINSSTNKILKSIKRSYEPSGMAISPNGSYLYVSNSGNNTVSILNSSSLSVIKTIYHLFGPNGVISSLNGAYLYVTNFYNNSISIINLSTLDKVYTIHGMDGPDGIALSQNGNVVYVSNEYNNSLSIINITSRKIINTITGLDTPSDVATTPDYSYVYVPNYGNSTLSIINTTTDSLVWTISKLNLPQNIAFSLNGNYVYIAESGNNTMSVVNLTNITIKLPDMLKLSQLYSTSQLVIQNQSATIFSAGAFGGTKPYNYTWYERLPGEQSYTPIYSSNSSYYTFTTSNATKPGSHLFELSVSNATAIVFSTPILVQVIPRLTLSTSATYQNIDFGQHITLSVIAKGSTGSYDYTWYNDTSAVPIKISGATSNTLYLNGTSLSKTSTFPVVNIGSNLTKGPYTITINNITGYSSTVTLSVYYNGVLTNKSIINAYLLPSTSSFNAAGHLLKLIINKLNGNIVSPTLNVTVITPFQYTVNVIGTGILNITSLDSSNSTYFNIFVNPKLVFEDPLNNTVTDSGLSTFPYTMFITGGTPPYKFLNTTIIGNSSFGFGSLQQKDNIELCGGFNNPEGFNSVQCSLSVASNATAGKYIIPVTLLDSSNGLPISNSSYDVHIQINPPLNAIGVGFNKNVILDVNQQYTYAINAFNGTSPYIYSWGWSQGVGGNTNTGTMGQFFNITVLSGCSGYIGNGPLNSSCVFKAISKNLTNIRIDGSVLDSALGGPGFSEQPKYFYSNLTIHPDPILLLNTTKQIIGTNQYENLTISVTGGVGPFNIRLYNLTGNDSVKNITLQSGDSNTMHIYASRSGNFTYEAIGTDTGTTIPYYFNSSKLLITVT